MLNYGKLSMVTAELYKDRGMEFLGTKNNYNHRYSIYNKNREMVKNIFSKLLNGEYLARREIKFIKSYISILDPIYRFSDYGFTLNQIEKYQKEPTTYHLIGDKIIEMPLRSKLKDLKVLGLIKRIDKRRYGIRKKGKLIYEAACRQSDLRQIQQ